MLTNKQIQNMEWRDLITLLSSQRKDLRRGWKKSRWVDLTKYKARLKRSAERRKKRYWDPKDDYRKKRLAQT